MASQQLPKLSIVTPSFNQARFIEEALLSVKEQNYPFVEHIVMDGGSTDGTTEILRRYSSQPGWEHLRWVSEPDRGQSDALNKGFRLASGDIIGWLNSDDRYRPRCFSSVVGAFARHSRADVIYGDYTCIDEEGRLLGIRREIRFSAFILYFLHMLYVPTPSSFFRRQIFCDGNWLDISLDYAMDYEFVVRLVQKGYKFQHVRGLLADFRLHDASKTVISQVKMCSEHNSIAMKYSPLLKHLKRQTPQRLALTGLRIAARGLRCSEKFVRGYYFETLRKPISPHLP